MTQIGDCSACTPGSFCAEPGAVSPTAKCEAGFICPGGNIEPRPTTPAGGDAATDGGPCPAGGYCETGSSVQKPCDGGYFNPNTGSTTVFDCTLCTRGMYCQGEATAIPTTPCYDGYYCEIGSTIPDQYPAQPGYFAKNTDPDDGYPNQGPW